MSPSKQQLIDHHITADQLQAKIQSSTLSQKPFITIARDPGSGGQPIAKLVAKKLNFRYYNEAIIEEIAKSSHQRQKIIAKVDEKSRNFMEDLLHSLFNPEFISENTYIKHLSKVILAIAHKGGAVILGRGANFIAPQEEGLNVLITAPKKTRIQRAIRYEKIDKTEARRRIDKISRQRRQFISQYFSKYYTNPKHYDLILNTNYFNIESSANIIIRAFKKKFPYSKIPARKVY